MQFLRVTLAYLVGVVVTTAIGTIIQTQFNLARVQALGAPIPADIRLQATVQDLSGFTPLFGPIVACGLLIAFIVAALLLRRFSWPRAPLYSLAGGTALLTAILSMNALFGINGIAATRSLTGTACLALSGVAGGLIFALLSARRTSQPMESDT